MDHPFDKWTNLLTNGPHLLTNGPPFWQMDQPFDKWTNLLTNDSRIFFPFLRVNFSRENKFRLRMFVRCRVFFFWDRGCLLGVGYFFFFYRGSRMFVRCGFFWDHECLTGVEYFFEITNVWQVYGIFEITNVWQVYGIFWDHECLTGVGYFLRSRMFDRCRVFFEIVDVC